MAADDAHWPYLKPRLTCDGLRRRNVHSSASISRKPSANPTSGDTTIGTTTLWSTPFHFTPPLEAMAAPISPPINACDDEDGSPKYHVIRFQAIAPTTAAKTTVSPSWFVGTSMMPLPTVAATFVDTSDPMRL